MFDFLKPNHNSSSSLSFTVPTALILLDNQAAFAHPSPAGSPPSSSRSNPLFEVNLTSLLVAFRLARETLASSSSSAQSPSLSPSSLFAKDENRGGEQQQQQHGNGGDQNRLEIIHIFHTSDNPGSPLHPHHPGKGHRPLDFARPITITDEDNGGGLAGERVIWKSVNSSPPIGSDLRTSLHHRGIKQLLFAGLTTDHCVSTTVRTAANLGVVEPGGRIVLVGDATATWSRAGIDAETVHAASVASLEGDFTKVVNTENVVKALRRVK